ncbi:MAG: class I SAM-dependent methyltransferase [Flavobacteriia bacterium]|nr:class I SAM-dependent methyltransferase [Flavobacteriia bacterium]
MTTKTVTTKKTWEVMMITIIEVLFRKPEEMPDLERIALEKAKGKVLEVGAGAGVHALEMMDNGLDVYAIDFSKGAVAHMKEKGIPSEQINFFDFQGKKFDTITMLMNGIGIAGTLANLEKTLLHCKSLLNEGGKILCDSSDIKYLYEDEDGALWVDLNSEYYGNFRFQMKYKGEIGPWFDWLYVDFDNLFQTAKKCGMKASRIYEKDDNYLAEITF